MKKTVEFKVTYLRQYLMAAFNHDQRMYHQNDKWAQTKIKMWCEECSTWTQESYYGADKSLKLLICSKNENDIMAEKFTAIWLAIKLDKLSCFLIWFSNFLDCKKLKRCGIMACPQ